MVLIVAAFACFSVMDKTNGTIVFSGVTRRYVLYVPKTYDRSKPTPLVISIHPAATWPLVEMNISRWNDVADEHGFIVVYPAGSGAFFGGFSPGPHVWPGERRDIQFICDLIDKLEANYNIDQNRIYANGMSNGGAMAFALSCELPDRIAAVGAVAPARPPIPGQDRCGDSKPVPMVAFHGTADKMAPYQGGTSPIAPRSFPKYPGLDSPCSATKPMQRRPHRHSNFSERPPPRTNCAENADVILYTIEGGGHTWPGGKHLAEWIAGHTTDDLDASRMMWEFFVQHPLGPK